MKTETGKRRLRKHLHDQGAVIDGDVPGTWGSLFQAAYYGNRIVLVKHLSRDSDNNRYCLSARFRDEADNLENRGIAVYVVMSDTGKWNRWPVLKQRMDPNRLLADGAWVFSL